MARTKTPAAAPMEADFFSELPDPIIQHIFSLLPYSSYVPMSSLSERFKSAERSSSYVILDGHTFNRPCRASAQESRLAASYEALTSRDPTVNIEKFRLGVTLFGRRNLDEYVNMLAQFAVDNCVGEVDIIVNPTRVKGKISRFYLPLQIRASLLSCKSVTRLKLSGFGLRVPEMLLVCCPRLEDLSLVDCALPSTLNLSSDVLKHLVLRKNYPGSRPRIPTLRIESDSLETLVFDQRPCDGYLSDPSSSNVDVKLCKSLRELVLYDGAYVEELIHEHIPELHALEILRLYGCQCPSIARLCTSSVKHMSIERLHNHGEASSVEIDAPELESLEFEGKYCYDLEIAAACRKLKSLKLKRLWIFREWLQRMLSEFEMLNDLGLYHFSGLARIDIAHGQLRSLQLHSFKSTMLASINAPKLENLYHHIENGMVMTPRVRLIGSRRLHGIFHLPQAYKVFNFCRILFQFKELTVFCEDRELLREFKDIFGHCHEQVKASQILQASKSGEKIAVCGFEGLNDFYYFNIRSI